MKIERFLRLGLFIAVITILPAIMLAACGSDSNSPGENPNPTITADINGLWFVQSTKDASNCGEGVYLDAWAAQFSQLGNGFVLEDSAGGQFSGTVSGNTVSLTGSYSFPVVDGTVTIESMTLTVSGNTMTGSSTETWSDGSDSCPVSSQITATRGTATMEIEPNDDDGQAQVITVSNGSAFLEGAVNRDSDQYDVYSLALSSSATIEVELSHFDSATYDLDLCVEGFTSDMFGIPIPATQCSTSVGAFEIVEIELAAGLPVYIEVYAWGGTTAGTAPYCVSIDLND